MTVGSEAGRRSRFLRRLVAQRPSAAGLLVAVAGTGLVTLFVHVTDLEGKAGPPVLYVLAVVAATIAGRLWSGLAAAVIASVELVSFALSPGASLDLDAMLAVSGFVATATITAYLLARLQELRAVAEEVTLRLSDAVERERAAREVAVRTALRAARLEALAARLAEAGSTEDVLAVAATEALEAADAAWGAIEVVPRDHPLAAIAEPTWELQPELLPALARDATTADAGSVAALPLAAGEPGTVLLLGLFPGDPLPNDRRRHLRTIAAEIDATLGRVRLRERERKIAETLQRSLLPERLPHVAGLRLDARYLPATDDVHVGGDWYDAIGLPDGRLAVAIGDVAGHGIDAASTMGQIRDALRSFVFEGYSPGRAVTRLNAMLARTGRSNLTTLVLAVVDPVSGSIAYANAGHLPPLVLDPAGRARYEERVRGLPLGVALDTAYREGAVRLEAGGALLLFTDGLVERRGASLDHGLERLARVAAAAGRRGAGVLAVVIEELGAAAQRDDDVAALLLEAVSLGDELGVPAA